MEVLPKLIVETIAKVGNEYQGGLPRNPSEPSSSGPLDGLLGGAPFSDPLGGLPWGGPFSGLPLGHPFSTSSSCGFQTTNFSPHMTIANSRRVIPPLKRLRPPPISDLFVCESWYLSHWFHTL